MYSIFLFQLYAMFLIKPSIFKKKYSTCYYEFTLKTRKPD